MVEYALLNKDKSIAVITPFVNQKQFSARNKATPEPFIWI